jgi:hypothetical protein
LHPLIAPVATRSVPIEIFIRCVGITLRVVAISGRDNDSAWPTQAPRALNMKSEIPNVLSLGATLDVPLAELKPL